MFGLVHMLLMLVMLLALIGAVLGLILAIVGLVLGTRPSPAPSAPTAVLAPPRPAAQQTSPPQDPASQAPKRNRLLWSGLIVLGASLLIGVAAIAGRFLLIGALYAMLSL